MRINSVRVMKDNNAKTVDGSRMDYYLKELAPSHMVIALTEPFKAERRVYFMRYKMDQEYFVRLTKNGYVLTDMGRWKAEETLQMLQDDVTFFMEHLFQFQSLCVKYVTEFNRLNKLLEESQSRRRTAVHWHDQAVLFKQSQRLKEKRDSLYRTMYESEFGPSARFLSHAMVLEFIEGVSKPTVMP